MFDITASIVTYCNDPAILNEAIESFLNTKLQVRLYIIDNSPTDKLRNEVVRDSRLLYHYNNQNVGFGKAHNYALQKSLEDSKYCLILNPDVYFGSSVLDNLFTYMEANNEVGLVSPKVVYPDESIQLSCRLIPSPLDMFARRIPLGEKIFRGRIRQHQYEDESFEHNLEVPFLLGCFLFSRTSVLKKVGGFDERFFMYMEDLDLCRRIGACSRLVFYANERIYHRYERASSKKIRIFYYHLRSMVQYFNKWGWLVDRERKKTNLAAKTHQIKNKNA
ncbi:glycosyltransferase family 2 protein [Pontibacter sp. E15-1]|uniref:glycosyltransferase family 2 protein n=1 Tax=Pontibacter sp. E15-1 TaxID=2919918 RepID=UPI001F4FCDB4|nr:glycosyltransferase family 2 protein [Pontibacter sp. E15-1]MCJ8166399.1 glycosyltransferase family 2 protein [Pontibacter sp. E15-1]